MVVATLNKDGPVKSIEPFLTGFIENNNYVGRPADVAVLKDGSMLISDDFNGAVYRVSYGTARIAGHWTANRGRPRRPASSSCLAIQRGRMRRLLAVILL